MDNKTVSIGDYLVAKNGTTKYIKLQCSPKADEATKQMVEKLKEVLGTDILYVNLYEPDFREKYNIPDFSKGRINVPALAASAKPAANKTTSPAKKNSKDEVNF